MYRSAGKSPANRFIHQPHTKRFIPGEHHVSCSIAKELAYTSYISLVISSFFLFMDIKLSVLSFEKLQSLARPLRLDIHVVVHWITRW